MFFYFHHYQKQLGLGEPLRLYGSLKMSDSYMTHFTISVDYFTNTTSTLGNIVWSNIHFLRVANRILP
jgi:hypothetical protein